VIRVLIHEALVAETIPLLHTFCERGAGAIEFCAQQKLGQKLIELLLSDGFNGDLGVLLETLLHFPVPELARLKSFRLGSYAGEHSTNAFADVSALACIYGYLPLDGARKQTTESRMLLTLMSLLRSFAFDPVLAFAERADLMLDVALEIKGDLTVFTNPILARPDVIRRLLVHPSSSGAAQSLLVDLRPEIVGDARDRLIDELFNRLHRASPATPLLAALKCLDFCDPSRFWPVIGRIDRGSLDALFDLVGIFPIEDVSPRITLLLPLLADNAVPRLRCVMPAMSESAGQWSGWEELAETIAGASNEALEQFALQLWPLTSFAGIVERMLLRLSVVITERTLDIVLTFEITDVNLAVFFKFLTDFLNAHLVTAVDRVCQKLLSEASHLDFNPTTLEVDVLFAFLSEAGYVESLIELLSLICAEDQDFHEILQDEISTLSARSAECPHIVMLNMCLNAQSLDDVLRMYQTSCAAVGDCEETSAFLFQYFDVKRFDPVPVFRGTFAVAPAMSKVEKRVLGAGARQLSKAEFLHLVTAWGKGVNGVCPRPEEIRKVHLLIKWRPECKDEILKIVRLDRSQRMPASLSSDSFKKYAPKIFEDHSSAPS
jgi:hypothetical protein